MAARARPGEGIAGLIRQAGKQAKRQAELNTDPEVDAFLSEMYPIDATDTRRRPVAPRIFSVIDYIEQPWGLHMNLFPVQRFIVKLYYHLPLDDKNKNIELRDMFNTRTLYRFTEVEYLRYLHNEGRCNIGEQDHERRQLVLAIGRRGGKCVEGDTLTLTDKGIYRIEELGEAPPDGFSSSNVGITQDAGRRATATAFYNGGVKSTFAIKTESGYNIAGTVNHRVKVMTASGRVEWLYLDEIQPGDFVALNRTTDLWASEPVDLQPFHNNDGRKDVVHVVLPPVLDEKLGNLLGYLVGDGTWGADHAVSVTVEHPETWVYLRQLFVEVFGEPRVQMDMRTENTGRLEFCSVRARRFLDAIGWKTECTRDEKMIPWSILRSPRSVVCAFLRGLFETDGCAEDGGRKITFSSASFRLAHEVQVVLLNLGIVSSIARKWRATTKRHYANLTLKGVRSRQRFAELIGFDSEKKRLPMLAALEVAQEGKSDTESIPHQRQRVRDWLESVPKRNAARGEPGWGRSKLREATGNVHKGGGEDLTYPKLRRALGVAKELSAGVVETSHFEELLRLDYYYDPVVSVEEREAQVYDLTVPDGSSFVANGVTNHNTTLSSLFASYEVYRLLNLSNPQEYYGLPNGNTIQIISVATDKDQAGILFREVSGHLSRCEYFTPYILSSTRSWIDFQTPADIERFGPIARQHDGKFISFNGKSSIRVTFRSSIAKGLRGMGNIVVILDEMAHFLNDGNTSAKEVYDAVTPSTAAFSPKSPDDNMPVGPVEARIICISSPLNKQGKFFDLYQTAMSGGEGSHNMISIQAPTWEINPTVPADYYKQKYHEDPAVFMTEHGAMFSDRVRGWIEREIDLQSCIDPDLRPKDHGAPRAPHQMGIDVAATNDGTSVCITHTEDDVIVLDYHEVWYAGVDWKEANPHLTDYSVPYARRLKEETRIDFEEIANWILSLTKRFHITEGIFDRWEGLSLEQQLHKRGLKQFTSEFIPRDTSSKMFQAAKLLMYDQRLRLYDYPLPQAVDEKTGQHSPFIAELLSLQSEQLSKNMISVEAPSGSHDDMSDAFVRSVWLSIKHIGKHHGYGNGPRNTVSKGTSTAAYQLARARLHGGFSPRTVPKSIGLRLRGR